MAKYTYQSQNANNTAEPVSAAGRYAVTGYTPPPGVVGKEAVKEMQRWLGGLTVDGIWGRRRAPPVADEASRKASE